MLISRVVPIISLSILATAMPMDYFRDWLSFGHESHSTNGFIDYGKRIQAGTNCKCDLQRAIMPKPPSPLPTPSTNLHLSHIAIGRGTQNYTCDLTNATAIPIAVGAVASLFNVSCLAVEAPALVASLPAIALDLPIPFAPATTTSSSPSSSKDNNNNYYDLSGYHYFLNSTTAFFNLDTPNHQYGLGAFKKLNSTAAPTDAMKGPMGKGDGAVPWLKLGSLDFEGQTFREVYRVNTAGGSPPVSCKGQRERIEVPYAAEYWLYT